MMEDKLKGLEESSNEEVGQHSQWQLREEV